MKCKDFEKTITKELLQDKDIKHVCCVKVSKDMIKNNLYKQRLEDIVYTWSYCNGIVIVNYCKY